MQQNKNIYSITTKQRRCVPIAIEVLNNGKLVVDGYTLTRKQALFCEELVNNGYNGSAAIRAAGYSTSSESVINKQSQENLRKPAIQTYIKVLEERLKKRQTQRVASIEDRRIALTEIFLNEEHKLTDRLKALDILNKMDAAYEQRINVTNNNPFENIKTEDLESLIDNKKS